MKLELLKILLVDDNHHMRVLLSEILRAIGVRHVFEASDGAEALQLMRSHAIDIVMTDLAMQPLDGIDFVRLVRNSPDSPNPMVPVIMITGHSTLRRVAEARDVGVTEFLSKPVTARVAFKPTSSILTPKRSIDERGAEVEIRTTGRHDPCVGIRGTPVVEAMMALVLADAFLRHRGQTGGGAFQPGAR